MLSIYNYQEVRKAVILRFVLFAKNINIIFQSTETAHNFPQTGFPQTMISEKWFAIYYYKKHFNVSSLETKYSDIFFIKYFL